ncbi:MAG TPA: AAA family ATPase [Streptosporangiaceae bacterium]|jgi:exodeoxyribonuclease V alpha subunit|nr:AAA family ATPase [Streptosporangiaceae bacterium]
MSTVSDESATRLFGEFCVAGLWPGVGRAMAEKLQAAGITSPDDVTAGRLELVEGVGPKRAARLAAAFTRAQPAYETAGLLTSCRVPARFAGQAVALLGPLAADQLREDPWKLLTLPPIKPEQADWFARQLLDEATPQDPRRGRALVVHLLNKASRDGHTAAPADVVLTALSRFGVGDPSAAVVAAIDDGSVLPFEAREAAAEADEAIDEEADQSDPGESTELPAGTLLALTQFAIAEEAVAEGLQRLAATAEPLPGTGDPIEAVTDAELDGKQHAAVAAVAEHGVSVLTGGPGTGKSRTVAAVVSLAAQRGLRVALAAPTGRAAKRLEELAGAPATTLHRLLGAQGQGISRPGADAPDNLFSDGPGFPGGEVSTGREGNWVFARGEEWPLDAELVVVDESSMLDVELAAALIEACADGTRLLLVGDPAQLPSIGPGRILADIIDSGAIPVTELTTLYRQKDGGTIAELATAVRGGDLPAVDSPEHEVVVVTARGSGEAAHRVTQLVTDSIPRALDIKAEDVQVVTPVHKGPAGTIELNRVLKAKLNPGPGANRGFDPGDRVVAVANHADDGFANGEVGTVVTADDGGLVVSFSGLPVTVPFRLLADLRHGWAITVHRAQGSEWGAVVAVFPGEAATMLSRPLVYTALTRAQHHLSVVHGSGPALARAVRTIGERPRQTRLAGLLAESLAELADLAGD